MSRAFRPGLWLTVFTVPTFLVLIGLGFWQLERRAWKHELVADLGSRMAEAPLTALPSVADPSIEYRRVHLDGRFLAGRDQFLVGRSFRGSTGYGVFTPFDLGGRILFVDRGWIPLSARDDAAWRIPEGGAPATVDGVLRLARGNQDSSASLGNEHYRLSIGAMARQAGLDPANVLPFTVTALGQGDGRTLPAAAPTAVDLSDNHLHYALTWFTLAVALVAIYVVASFHPRHSRRTSR
jgi:surfeit locus 1 family protein